MLFSPRNLHKNEKFTRLQLYILFVQHGDVYKCLGCTIFALGDVAAFITSLGVGGVTPRTDSIAVRVPAVVQLQTISSSGSPPEQDRQWDRLFQGSYSAVSSMSSAPVALHWKCISGHEGLSAASLVGLFLYAHQIKCVAVGAHFLHTPQILEKAVIGQINVNLKLLSTNFFGHFSADELLHRLKTHTHQEVLLGIMWWFLAPTRRLTLTLRSNISMYLKSSVWPPDELANNIHYPFGSGLVSSTENNIHFFSS